MEYRTIKATKMPALGFGTWDLSGATCTEMVRYALEIGYRHIDAARMYGNETEVGRGIATSGVERADIFLTTKVWNDRLARDDVKRSLEESLQALNTDYVDLFLIHWPNRTTPLAETLDAMSALQLSGQTRHIGVSNFPVKLMREAIEECGADIVCNQVEYHPRLSQRPVLDYARSKDVVVTAYSPLAQGKHLDADRPVLTPIARRHNKTLQQVMLRWLMQQDSVAAVPKTSNKAHCLANFEIFDFELTADEMRQLDALADPAGRVIEIDNPPDWDIG